MATSKVILNPARGVQFANLNTDVLVASGIPNMPATSPFLFGNLWYNLPSGLIPANFSSILAFYTPGSIYNQAQVTFGNTGEFPGWAGALGFRVRGGPDAGGNDIVFASSGPSPVPMNGTWRNLIFAFNSNTGVFKAYLHGAPLAMQVRYATPGAPPYEADFSKSVAVTMGKGMLAELWVQAGTDFTTIIDDPVFREKFFKNGMPMYLGPNGALPLGTPPQIYLSGGAKFFPLNLAAFAKFSLDQNLKTYTPPFVVSGNPPLDAPTDPFGGPIA